MHFIRKKFALLTVEYIITKRFAVFLVSLLHNEHTHTHTHTHAHTHTHTHTHTHAHTVIGGSVSLKHRKQTIQWHVNSNITVYTAP